MLNPLKKYGDVMRCRKAQQLISTHLDGELDAARLEAVRKHLSTCPSCTAFSADAGRLAEDIGRFVAPEPRWGFTDRLMARLPEQRPVPGASTGWLDLLRPVPAGLGAVAFCCGVILVVMANGEPPVEDQTTSPDIEAIAGDYFDTLAEISVDEQLLALLPDEEE